MSSKNIGRRNTLAIIVVTSVILVFSFGQIVRWHRANQNEQALNDMASIVHRAEQAIEEAASLANVRNQEVEQSSEAFDQQYRSIQKQLNQLDIHRLKLEPNEIPISIERGMKIDELQRRRLR